MSNNDMNEQLTDLQIRLTHQEATIDELTDNALQQQRLLERIMKELDQLKSVVRELAPADPAANLDEKPPHY